MISVIIPAYNRGKSIGRSIESVLRQKYSDFELIIVDDCSTDDTADVIRRLEDSRIRYEKLLKNSGVHVARNRGLEVSRGEFVVFFDSDDELFPDALERLHSVLSDSSFGIASAPYRLPDGTLTSFDRQEGEVPFDEYMCNHGMRDNKAAIMMFRRSAIGELRWFERNLDFVFCRRVAARTRQYFISEPLASYHTQKGGTVSSMTAARKIPNKALSISRARIIADFADDFADLLKAKSPMMYGFYAYGAAVGLLLGGDVERSRRLAKAAMTYQPRTKYRLFYLFSLVPGSNFLLGFLFDVKSMWLRTVK